MVGAVSVALEIWPDLGSLMIGAFVIPAAFFFHRFWTLEDEMQKTTQRQLFYRNLVILGASVVFFGTFVALGSELRFSITAPLFDFWKLIRYRVHIPHRTRDTRGKEGDEEDETRG
jgi:putative oxidoreductase